MHARFAICLLLIGSIGLYGGGISAQEPFPADAPDTAREEPIALDEVSIEQVQEDPSADIECYTCEPSHRCSSDPCNCKSGGLAINAWLEQGFTWNPDSPRNRFNTPQTFNDRANEYQMNQLYLSFERAVNAQRGAWDIGGRVDLLYGSDYFFTTAAGLETRRDGTPRWNSRSGPRGAGASLYGLAMPQIYAEIVAPIGNGLNIKMGHFYTIIGYESPMASDNFFYSHAYTMQYGEPFTHTGLLAAYNVSPCLAFQAGFTRGWDNWEDSNDDLGFLGGFTLVSPDEQTSLAFALHTGDEDDAGINNRTVYSIVVKRQVSDRLSYVFQHDFGIEEDAEVNRQFGLDGAKWYGINQYLFYTLDCETTLGLRFEWFRDQDNARVLGIPQEPFVTGGNYFAITLGLNWELNSRISLRPEARWDWSNVEAPALNVDGMYDDFSDKNQFTLGTDLIIKF